MSKIVAIVSSPTKSNGNGEAIVKALLQNAPEGSTYTIHRINQLEDIKACQACMGCKSAGRCVRKDDLTPVLEDIAAADTVIVSGPDYFGHMCAQYRILEDRMYGFIGPNFSLNIPAGKKCVTVVTCASGVDGAKIISENLNRVMSFYFKMDVIGEIVYSVLDGPAAESEVIKQQAAEIGAKL